MLIDINKLSIHFQGEKLKFQELNDEDYLVSEQKQTIFTK